MFRHCALPAALLLAGQAVAEEFSFDIDAFEKKPFEWRGYTELRYEQMDLNRDSLLYELNYPEGETRESRLNGALELSGDYRRDDTRISATWHGTAFDDSRESHSEGRLYEGYLNRKESSELSWELGKRAIKWGKGYAWNPVGFIERAKDPTDPELGREGYVIAAADWVHSRSGDLKTIGFTPVVLPVRENLNDEYGAQESNNFAAKLYLLYRDIDIDLMLLSHGTRPGRIGADFSLNLASHIELHGEWAFTPDNPKRLITDSGLTVEEEDSHNYLLGLRYLSESDTTWIIEYLHQDQGYNEEEMDAFFERLATSPQPEALIENAQQAGYLRPTPMRDYLYLRASQKDPFDWLYTSLALTAIGNLDDGSYLLMPEFSYTGVKNLELRLRLSSLGGDEATEYGEKLNRQKIEARLRYFF
jgi:hypothetical protein